MPKGKFDKAQKDHIESFLPDFVKEMDRGVEGIQLTRWKQTLASNILDTPLFSTLDLNEYPRKTWFEMIVRKFTNYRNQVYLKSSDRVSTTALSTKKANPLLKFSSVISGRQLFAQENSESLTAASKQRVDDTDHKSLAAVYQIILKERWDSLTGEEQASWNDRAELEAGNITQNQQEFAHTMTLALRDLCQGTLLGDAEMMLFYAFRQPDNEDLMAGTIHGHSVHNQQNFGGGPEDLDLNYGKPWTDFAESVIPRMVAANPLIPRNSDDQPVFPMVNLDTVAIADLRMLLSDYFEQCWMAARGSFGNKVKSIPWDDILSNPDRHYDTARDFFGTKLDHPQNLSTVEVITLAQGLLSTSVIGSPTPFHFLNTEGQVLVPSTPEMIPPPLSSSPHTSPTAPAPLTLPLVLSSVPAHPAQPAPASPPKSLGGGEVAQSPRPVPRTKSKRSRDEAKPDTDHSDGSRSLKKAKEWAKHNPEDPSCSAHPQRRSGRKKVTTSVPASKRVSKPKKKWPGWTEVDSDGNEVLGSD